MLCVRNKTHSKTSNTTAGVTFCLGRVISSQHCWGQQSIKKNLASTVHNTSFWHKINKQTLNVKSVKQNMTLKSIDQHRITLIKSKQWFTCKWSIEVVGWKQATTNKSQPEVPFFFSFFFSFFFFWWFFFFLFLMVSVKGCWYHLLLCLTPYLSVMSKITHKTNIKDWKTSTHERTLTEWHTEYNTNTKCSCSWLLPPSPLNHHQCPCW